MNISASMIQSGEDAAEREEASWWAGRDPEMEIFRMVCPDVDAAGGKVFRSLAGCCCDQKGGQLWFPLESIQSEL